MIEIWSPALGGSGPTTTDPVSECLSRWNRLTALLLLLLLCVLLHLVFALDVIDLIPCCIITCGLAPSPKHKSALFEMIP